MNTDIELLKAQARIELDKLEAQAAAKDVAGKAIGKHVESPCILQVHIPGCDLVLTPQKHCAHVLHIS